MSAVIGEKSPTVTFASLESHKVGGIVRLPREIDEQSIVLMGQFLARYGAFGSPAPLASEGTYRVISWPRFC